MNERVEAKAGIDDVNKALLEVCSELEGKAGVQELAALKAAGGAGASAGGGGAGDGGVSGRWLWKTGNLKTNKCVPWNVQTLNTAPQALVWERDAGQVCGWGDG